MPKQMLSGTLDEQCQFLYELGQRKMEQGNYTGAVHAFGEIVKYAPDYRDAADLLAAAKRRKSEQRFLIVIAIIGAVAMIGVGSALDLSNDLYLLALALVGALLGYGVGSLVTNRQRGGN
jgi:hypothetical protein